MISDRDFDAFTQEFVKEFPDVFLCFTHPGDRHTYAIGDEVFSERVKSSARTMAWLYMRAYRAERRYADCARELEWLGGQYDNHLNKGGVIL